MNARAVLCAGVIVIEEGSLLLVLRRNEPSAGRWSLPGGRAKPAEGLRAAARREALEETGLALDLAELVGTTWFPIADGRLVVFDFRGRRRVDGGPLRSGDDALDAAFVPLGEVRSLELADGLAGWLVAHGILDGGS